MIHPASDIARRRQALAKAERTFGPHHPRTVSIREQLGHAYFLRGFPEQAWMLLERVVWDLDRLVGPLHKRTLVARKNLANAYFDVLRIADAHALYEYTAGQAAAVLGPLDICTMLARTGVANCLQEMRRFDEAIAAYDRVLPDWATGFGPAHNTLLWSRHGLAQAWDGAGRTQEAMTQYRRLLSDCEQLIGPDAPLARYLTANLVPQPRPWRATEPLSPHQLWLVSLSAIQAARAHGYVLDALYPHAWLSRRDAEGTLKGDWKVTSREDLLSTLEWLADSGHRAIMALQLGHPPAAWDFTRAAFVVRDGYAAEYIDEPEAWQLLEDIAGQVAGCYGSWQEFSDDYLAGRGLWHGRRTDEDDYPKTPLQTTTTLSWLLDPANPQSPWNRVPWDTVGRPDAPAACQ